ncbi:MAG: RecG wedge domain, partial [Pseudomonadota bacterium]
MFSKIKQHFSLEEEKLETLIKEVGGEDLSNLLFFLPKKYEVFLSTKNIKNEENKDVLIKLQIQSIDGIINKGAYNTRIGKKPVTISCIAENEFEVELVFFQISNVLLQKLKVNSLIICQGKLTINKTKVQIIHPKISHNLNNHKEDCIVQTINQFEMVQSVSTINKNKIIKINPVYHYIEGLYQYQIQNIIKKAIQIIQTEHQNELEQI